MTLDEALAMFLIQLEADGRSPHTIGQYRRHIASLGAWLGPRDLLSIGHEDVARFLASPEARSREGGGQRSKITMNSVRTSLRVMFRYLHEAGVIPQNPARLVQRAICGSPPPKALADEDRERLLLTLAADPSAEGRRDHALFALMLTSGIRVGSAVALDVQDLDLDRGEVWLRTTKGDRPETVFLPRATCEVLRGYVGPRTFGPLFPGRGSARITPRHVGRRFEAWLHRAGITRHASPHALRHSFAMAIYKKSGDIALTQAALRHRSITSTLVYARVDPVQIRQAVEV